MIIFFSKNSTFRRFFSCIYLLIFFTGRLQPDSSPQQKEIEELLRKVDTLFAKIPNKNMQELLIIQEKRRLLTDLLGDQPDTDRDSEFYKPKFSVTLTDDEKKIDIFTRIKKKYIGEIPNSVNDLINYFSYQKDCIKAGATIQNKILLVGRPGNGKSYLVSILAQELELPLFSYSASFFSDKYIGEASRKIRRAFAEAKKLNRPCLIFIDEIDALATTRNENSHQDQRATLITLLTELQELQSEKNIFVIAATNDLKSLDEAVKDRFAGAISGVPDLKDAERSLLFQKIFSENGIVAEVDLCNRLGSVTKGNLYLPNPKDRYGHIMQPVTFSNRDIVSVVEKATFRKFITCKQDATKCNESLCKFLKKAIQQAGKPTTFNTAKTQKYCDGI